MFVGFELLVMTGPQKSIFYPRLSCLQTVPKLFGNVANIFEKFRKYSKGFFTSNLLIFEKGTILESWENLNSGKTNFCKIVQIFANKRSSVLVCCKFCLFGNFTFLFFVFSINIRDLLMRVIAYSDSWERKREIQTVWEREGVRVYRKKRVNVCLR